MTAKWFYRFLLNGLMLNFIYFFSSQTAFAKSNLPNAVENFCQNYSGQSNFLDNLHEKIMSDSKFRNQLVDKMKNKEAVGCQVALSDYLKKFTDPNYMDTPSKHFGSNLLLAFASNLPIATELIEKEIMRGTFVDWIDVFEKSDEQAYILSLSKWVDKVAALVRDLDHAQLVSLEYYGKMEESASPLQTPEAIPIWNPILVDKFISKIDEKKFVITPNVFSNLNIIYAASNQSFREIFLKKMVQVVKLNEEKWVESFRKEPSWVQFRLLPLMTKVGGGYVKRELIWLTQNHQNFKIRSVAQTSLSKLNSINQLIKNPTNE